MYIDVLLKTEFHSSKCRERDVEDRQKNPDVNGVSCMRILQLGIYTNGQLYFEPQTDRYLEGDLQLH